MGTRDSTEDFILYSHPGQMTGGSHSVSQGCLDELTYEYIQSTHSFVYQASRQAQGMASPSQGREWQRNKVLKELMKEADSSPEMHLAQARVLPVCYGWRRAQRRSRPFSQGKVGVETRVEMGYRDSNKE